MFFQNDKKYHNGIKVSNTDHLRFPVTIDKVVVTITEDNFLLKDEVKVQQLESDNDFEKSMIDSLYGSAISLPYPPKSIEAGEGLTLKLLWDYPCPMTVKRMVDVEKLGEDMFECILTNFESERVYIHSCSVTLKVCGETEADFRMEMEMK